MKSPKIPMIMISPVQRYFLSWIGAFFLALVVALVVVESARLLLEKRNETLLQAETQRQAMEISAQTLNGNVMGAVTVLGLVHQATKNVLRGVVAVDDPATFQALQAVGWANNASGAFIVNNQGVVATAWDRNGDPNTGQNIQFRPYFKLALEGKQNVYAGVSLKSGLRSMFFASPVRDDTTTTSPVIGVLVVRLDSSRVDDAIKAWSGPALLLSPQGVVFGSNRNQWVQQLAGPATEQRITEIRALQQFGKAFDKGTPVSLPFDLERRNVLIDQRRHAVAKAPVKWNDPNGEWTLALLSDLDNVLSPVQRSILGGGAFVFVFALSGILLIWQRRLRYANHERQAAEDALRRNANRLENDAMTKSRMAAVSVELSKAVSVDEFTTTLMRHSTQMLEVDYGAFYLLKTADELKSEASLQANGAIKNQAAQLVAVGGHGVLARELPTLAIGQGLVGQCAKDLKPILVSGTSEQTFRIVWGAASVTPSSLVLRPVAQGERLQGVLVLASMRPITPEQQALLDALIPMVAMHLDILKRNLGTLHQAEKLNNLRLLQQALFENLPMGMFLTTAGVIRQMNPCVAEILGPGSECLLGEHASILYPSSQAYAEFAARVAPFLIAGTVVEEEVNLIRLDGSQVMCRISGRPVNIDGNNHTAIWLVEDITERKEAEIGILKARELAEANSRAKSAFIARMSHEIRTPMNAIIGMAHLVLKTRLLGDQRNYLDKIQDSAVALLIGINDILDFSKIEAGQLDMEQLDFQLEEVFDNTTSLIGFQARKKGLNLRFDIAPEVPTALVGDPLRLGQILVSLGHNAVKFSSKGEIVIGVQVNTRDEQGVSLEFRVQDTGIGMSEKQQAALFRPFGETIRYHHEIKVGSSSGLGLIITQELVNLLGGTIRVESELGKGTCFYFTARFAMQTSGDNSQALLAAAKRRDNTTSAMQKLAGTRVLLVEDTAIIRELGVALLEHAGVEVKVAEHGQQALDILQHDTNFDGILMDCDMPVMDGYTATRAIRSNPLFATLPIIALTGNAMVGDREKALDAGMNDHLSNPLNIKHMFATLAYWIQRKKPSKSS